MCLLNSFPPISFFIPEHLIYKGPEMPSSHGNDIVGAIRSLEHSEDGESLRFMLRGLIESKYSEYASDLAGESIGNLLDGIAEIQGVDDGFDPSEVVQGIFEQAFDCMYPDGIDSDAQELFQKVRDTLPHATTKVRQDVQKRGAELIDRAEEGLSSPRLKELRTRLRNLNRNYAEYIARANKAAIRHLRAEAALNKLMKGYGFHYDRTAQSEMFYHYTDDYQLVYDVESSRLTDGEAEKVDEITGYWQSRGWHYYRSNSAVEACEASINRIETQINEEEARERHRRA